MLRVDREAITKTNKSNLESMDKALESRLLQLVSEKDIPDDQLDNIKKEIITISKNYKQKSSFFYELE